MGGVRPQGLGREVERGNGEERRGKSDRDIYRGYTVGSLTQIQCVMTVVLLCSQDRRQPGVVVSMLVSIHQQAPGPLYYLDGDCL